MARVIVPLIIIASLAASVLTFWNLYQTDLALDQMNRDLQKINRVLEVRRG